MTSEAQSTDPRSHTPGPWSTGGTFNPGTPYEKQWVWGPRSRPADQSGPLVCQNARPADARLIAVAPDLLAALKELLASSLAPYPSFEEGKVAQDAWSDRKAKARNEAAFLIAKAEGR